MKENTKNKREIIISEDDMKMPLADLVKSDKRMVIIDDMSDYYDVVFAIENSIYRYWKHNPKLNDFDVIRTIDSIYKSFDAQKDNTLGLAITNELKAMLIFRGINSEEKYSLGEIRSCISRLRQIVIQHKSPDGIGYLKWTKTFFEGKLPQTEEEIREYIKQNES